MVDINNVRIEVVKVLLIDNLILKHILPMFRVDAPILPNNI